LAVKSPIAVISFSNEGYISQVEMESLLTEMYDGNAKFVTFAHDYKRYVGAQIGIYNNVGVQVGEVSHLKNLEYIYVVATPEISFENLEKIGHDDVTGSKGIERFTPTLF
jgi:adenine-specific DNA-methyltransferase